MVSCSICGRELTADASVVRGIGPVCRSKKLLESLNSPNSICDYTVEFISNENICIIHEKSDPKNPKISLTNCIEHVIKEVTSVNELCPEEWDFVQHSSWKKNLFGGYEEWDLVDLKTPDVNWKYIWHSDVQSEEQEFSKPLLIARVKAYREGVSTVLNFELKEEA